MTKQLHATFFLAVLTLLAPALWGQVTIIDDNLNTDTSIDYTVVNGGASGGGDGTLVWAYDYGADGIPPAPGTTDASTTGVRMSVNDTSETNAANGIDQTEAYTIFHNTEIVGVTDYTMTVDVWMGVWSALDTGSTQSAQIGVSGDGVTRNHLFELVDAGCCDFSGSGQFIALSGDGGDSSDYRHWEDNANGGTTPGPVNNFDPDYLSPDMGTNVVTDNFIGFFEEIANANAPIPGVIGNNWATVKVEVLQSEGLIKYYVRGGLPETTGDPSIDPPLPPEFLQVVESELQDAEGFVNFGLADMYSSFVPADQILNQFAIFDNLRVEGTNLPGGGVDGDFNNDDMWDCADIDALVAEIFAGTDNPDFDMNGDGMVTREDITDADDGWLAVGGAENAALTGGNAFIEGDANLSGDVDVSDFNVFNNNKFTSNAAWCLGDFNADGSIDVSDFNIFNTNKFTSSMDSPAAVPEPGCWLLLLVGCAVLCWRR